MSIIHPVEVCGGKALPVLLPVLLSVPHAGRAYDCALVEQARLGLASLERLEDPLVDRLVQGALRRGIGAVIARAPRAAIDCNRAEDEVDPRAIAGRSGSAASARARGGLGIIPTRQSEIGALWRAPISEAEFERRLATIHRPYHQAIAQALAELAQGFGEVLLIDCHSMPPRPRGQAQIVIGDRHGASAAGWLSEGAVGIARRLGFTATRNVPFAGGHIVEHHGRPARGIHALQVEVDRSCYLQRDLRTPGPGFARVEQLFETLGVELGEQLARRYRDAAE